MEKCQETKVVTQDKLSRCARPHRKRNDKAKEKQAESQNYILGLSKVDIYLNGAECELCVCYSQMPWQLGFLYMAWHILGKSTQERSTVNRN